MNVIITGSTGMVGKAVLIECLEHEAVEKVLVINRNSLNKEHKKLEEIILKDFSDFASIQDLMIGYDACFHCMGVSSIGMNEESFSKMTFDFTKSLVDSLYESSPNSVFNYVSGTGTDITENGKTMWARVKGRTENYIFNKGFKDAYAFRPGAILPEKGVKSKTGWYNIIYVILRPFFPLIKKLDSVATSSNVGLAMINSVLKPQELKILENKNINSTANL